MYVVALWSLVEVSLRARQFVVELPSFHFENPIPGPFTSVACELVTTRKKSSLHWFVTKN